MAKKYLVDSEGLARLVANLKAMLGDKVDAVDGKGLSTEDFTTSLKNKLDSLENYTLFYFEFAVSCMRWRRAQPIRKKRLDSFNNYPAFFILS